MTPNQRHRYTLQHPNWTGRAPRRSAMIVDIDKVPVRPLVLDPAFLIGVVIGAGFVLALASLSWM